MGGALWSTGRATGFGLSKRSCHFCPFSLPRTRIQRCGAVKRIVVQIYPVRERM